MSVAVFLQGYQEHDHSLQAFLDIDRKHNYCAGHSLEVHSIITRVPAWDRLNGEQVPLFSAKP
jgi:hypothetical protein